MNCTCKVEQRRLTPGVFNLKQFLNGSETMIWTLDNCMTNEGTCDLKNYDAFLVLSVGGEIDEIMLTKRQSGDTLQLLWNVGTYATALSGYVKYQLVFRSATFDTLGVIAEDPEVNGVYALTDNNLTGNDRIFQKYENGYQIKWDDASGCWSLYRTDGVSVIDSQTTPSTEPHCGTWNNVAVGNNEAAAWISDEAIMYISDSIAADQAVTAGFPTILRQLWARLQKAGVTSVNGKSGIVELFPEDIGAAADDHGHEIAEILGLIDALAGKSDTGHGHAMAEVAGLIAALNGKTDTGHGHQIADTTGLQAALDGKAPTEHGHIIGNTTGLQAALDGKLPLSGGTMTGDILFKSGAGLRMKEASDLYITHSSGRRANRTYIMGGDNYNYGASLYLYGSEHGSVPGQFSIAANKGTGGKILNGRPDGTLTWGGEDITLGYPNYAAGVSVAATTSYKVTQNGWLYVRISKDTTQVKINGGLVAYCRNDYDAEACVVVPVKKDDILTSTLTEGLKIIFYPLL